MEKPKASILPLPASAQFHFALAQDEYVGVLSACQYFAKNLRSDSEKATMLRALAKLDRPTGISVPSEAENEAKPAVLPIPEIVQAASDMLAGGPAVKPKRGLAGLGGKKG